MNKKILLIDDDEDDIELFLEAMKMINPSVECSAISHPEVAVKNLIDKKISPDLIFLDLNMPALTGQQVLETIKAKTDLKEIPVVVLSTSTRQETVEEVIELGAESFYTKPSSFQRLKDLISSVLIKFHLN